MSEEVTRVLVVDDEEGMRQGCRKILTPEGFIVEDAPDGVAGLELFQSRNDFAMALVDLNMPRMGGMELIEKLRALDKDVVILVITAYATIETAVEATHRGAYAYIPKPFTPDELLLPVRNGIEHRALTIEARRLREEKENRLLEVAVERSRCNTIISCMTDGVLVVNRDRQVVLRNAAIMSTMPSCAQQPLSSPVSDIGCTMLAELIEQALSADSGPVIESKEITVDKQTFLASASPVFEPDATLVGAVAVLRDITALKKLDTTKSMFVSMVAHELKSPLAAVANYLQLILNGLVEGDPDKQRHMLTRSLLRISALRELIEELLDLQAIKAGKFALRRSPVNISEVVKNSLDTNREKAEQKKIALNLSIAPGTEDTRVLADPDSLLIIFGNLINNAVKYSHSDGHVDLHVAQNDVFVHVTVKDDGIGMAEDELEHAFDEFYRAKNQHTVEIPGSGLGLSLVKRLVETHQGHVAAVSVPDRGTTFTVSLPIAD